jgi:exosortase/archaeosortase family protein
MLWLGGYVAALLSFLRRAPAGRCAANGAAALVLILAANVLRNALLVFGEAGIVRLPAWSHEAIGLLAFGLALWPLCRLVAWRPHAAPTP